jgi:hypothetical protein
MLPKIEYVYRGHITSYEEAEILQEGIVPTSIDNLMLHLPAYNGKGVVREDKGDITTTINAKDSWQINCTLSHIPGLLRPIDKTLGVSTHFPKNGKVDFTLNKLVSERRMNAILREIEKVTKVDSFILLNADLPRNSSDGYRMPKSWLWDIYDEVARRIDPFFNTDDLYNYNVKSCIRAADGRIEYMKNGEGHLLDLDGYPCDPERDSTLVIDAYIKRVERVIQEMYDDGIIYLSYASDTFDKITERLYKPKSPLFPSAVELYYN